MSEEAQVEVEVEVEAPAGDTSPDVVVVTDGGGDSGTDGDVVRLLSDLTATVAVLGERLASVEARTTEAQITAEVAENIAGDAMAEADRLAVETEEALAAVAEEADAATAEVQAEVDDVAPAREHPWFRSRSVLREKDTA